MELVGPHGEQSRDGRQKSDRVHVEASRDAEGADHSRPYGWPYDAGAVEEGGVQSDGVGQVRRPHHLDHEALPGGRFDGFSDPAHRGQGVDKSDGYHLQVGEYRQGERQKQLKHLGGKDRGPLGQAVGQDPAVEREQQSGAEADGHGQPQSEGRVCQGENEPAQCDVLHPGTRHRDELAEPEQTIVAYAQGAKCLRHRAHAYHAGIIR